MSQESRNLEVYNDLVSTEQSIIGNFTHKSGGTFNPVTEVHTNQITTVSSCVVVFVKASKNEATPDDFQLERGDRVLICAALGQVPAHGDFLTLNADDWEILTSIESSAGDNSLFRCFVKKG